MSTSELTGVTNRSASYSSLRTSSSEAEPRNFRTCFSSSPRATVTRDDSTEQSVLPKSPQIIFSGSSTLPRSSSESKRLEHHEGKPDQQASVLTLQLEGAYGCSMSVSEKTGSSSREDTISPMVSVKTGLLYIFLDAIASLAMSQDCMSVTH